MRIWLFPIEPIEERYSAQWARWWPRELQVLGHEVLVVEGQRLEPGIARGEFLDVFDTNYWKSSQLAVFARAMRDGYVKDGDVVLLHDAWNPAVEQIEYMRKLSGRAIKVAGVFHAGTYDPHDLLAQRGLGWSLGDAEMSWCRIYDAMFFATRFHETMLLRARPVAYGKTHVTGLPLYAGEWAQHATPWAERERIVVFPHRLAPEKQPEEFEKLERAYRDRYPDDKVQFIRTKDACKTKASYYELLGRARVAFSAALQETWGIAMLEAASLGCYPVVPNRLSYPETFETAPRYSRPHEAIPILRAALDRDTPYAYDGARWEGAIARIAKVLEGL